MASSALSHNTPGVRSPVLARAMSLSAMVRLTVPSAQGDAGHLESYTQSTPGLQVEIIRAFEIGRDSHGCAPLAACQAGAQSVSQPSVPDCWLLLANDGKQLTPKSASDNQVRIPSVRTDGVITDASLERPPGRAPGIGEPPALACSQGLPRPIRQAGSLTRLAASRA